MACELHGWRGAGTCVDCLKLEDDARGFWERAVLTFAYRLEPAEAATKADALTLLWKERVRRGR